MGKNRVFSSSSPALKPMGIGSIVLTVAAGIGGVACKGEVQQSEHSHFPMGFSTRGGE